MRYLVCNKEKNSLVVFQFAEEHRNKIITNKIIRRILLEENICFGKEKNYIPVTSNFKNSRKLHFQF
jgi:hypothetical protein